MYNGAARLVDGAVPWPIEAAAREAIEEAMTGDGAMTGEEAPDSDGAASATFPRQKQGQEHDAAGHAEPKEVTRTRAA